jgi:hypothetical protein
MARVLIVSPHFPPVNAPDMQRVRMSLPHFAEFGWEPYVLAVAPTGDETLDPLLIETVPADIKVERVQAIPRAISDRVGIGNIALRALPSLYIAGSRLLASGKFDLVYFSTTMFFSMPLGRVWRRRFGVPYVLDIQDPWLSDYYREHPESSPPPKYSLARRVHAVLEPWTMKDVDAVISVSDAYSITLRKRYPWLTEDRCTTLPFAASQRDFDVLDTYPQPNRSFRKESGVAHGVYVGRGGDDMKPALKILFEALKAGIASDPNVFGLLKLHFVGTDYATDARARKTVEPVAQEIGIRELVSERTARVPYFEALQLMKDANFLILVGSDDPAYTASKVYPYLMSGKPILAVVHERSGLVPLLREARAGVVVTFTDGGEETAVAQLLAEWRRMMTQLEKPHRTNEHVLERYSAREMTVRQCAVFDGVLARSRRQAA